MNRLAALSVVVAPLAVAIVEPVCAEVGSFEPMTSLEGTVRDSSGPVSGAIVCVQATTRRAVSNEHGWFALHDLEPSRPITLTAWAPGYYIGGGTDHVAGVDPVELTLTPHPAEDNPDYRWIGAFSRDGDEESCENCHARADARDPPLLFDQWTHDAHANAARNIRFLTMYAGTDVHGNKSPDTRHGAMRDYGTFPLPVDSRVAYFGPGYKLDFPATSGNCASCHAPVAAADAPYGTDPTTLEGLEAEGVSCDFCHKVWDVRLDPDTRRPYPNMPGVLSYEFRRPPDGHQLFVGPLDDVAPGEDVYRPLQRESRYCAPCHAGSFWGTPIYDSFGEWLESPYSHPDSGRTCQDCHMPRGWGDHFARLDKGGRRRDPATLSGHRMLGAGDEAFLRGAVTLTSVVEIQGPRLSVEVEIINDGAGHHVPTDSPLRHMILIVSATDSDGGPLDQLDGPTIPDWCGVGDPDEGYYAGLPGTAYAKILRDSWTGSSPTGAYWNRTHIVRDDRIPALGRDVTRFDFDAQGAETAVVVSVRLVYRRAFIELVDWKSWDVPDVVMARRVLSIKEGDRDGRYDMIRS